MGVKLFIREELVLSSNRDYNLCFTHEEIELREVKLLPQGPTAEER